ncbi:hypothetical protein CBR_g44551 [Chara braunii]|uniref:RING-type E3 ubiquitin transferase n=1 Tax=Chara braunii TaxID=69332 RepID=A0A388LXU6_CHABU|nr:hypothetical protein CBR_g44551 [Chara braunii]|eukprot:GBG87095.1 hypothetical protein CBR_g44551 [Chara braunii]
MASPSTSTSDEGGTRFEASRRSDGSSSTRIGRSISGQQEEMRAGLHSTGTMGGVENRTVTGDLSHRSCPGGGGAELGAEKPSSTAGAVGGGGAAGANVGTANGGTGGSNSGDGGSFECNICLELANDPVITLCGHLFCWPCLYRWLQMHVAGKECPVCKAGVDEEKVIPLYGRGNPNQMDPRKKPVTGAGIPARPQGQRPESTRPQHQRHHHHQHGPGFGFMDGEGGGPFATAQFANFTLSAGFGLFPSLFGLQYHFPGDGGFGFGPTLVGGMAAGPHGAAGQRAGQSPEVQQQQFLSKLLLMLGSFVIICLLLL